MVKARGELVDRIRVQTERPRTTLELVLFDHCTVVNVFVPVDVDRINKGWLVETSYEIPGKLTVTEALDYVQVMKRLKDADA
jgi:hypothetical protein